MAAKQTRGRLKKNPGDDLLRRLQKLIYEFHALGRFEEARPHILWLMEIAEAETRRPPEPAQTFNA